MPSLLLRKFVELSLLAILVAVPMMYHFSLTAESARAVQGVIGSGDFWREQIGPLATGMLPVLESKFSAWFVLGIVAMAGYVALRLYESVSRVGLAERNSSRDSRHRMIPLAAAMVFLILALASFLLWPPAVPREAVQLSGGGEATKVGGLVSLLGQRLGGGGLFFSMTAWLQLAFAFFFFLVCEDMIRARGMVNRIVGLIVLVGIVNALIVILLKLEFPPLMSVWVRFGAEDTRNNLGAFIGHNTGVSSYMMAPILIAMTWLVSLQPRSNAVYRGALTAALLTMALAMLLAQSRAAVPIVVVCAGLLLWLLGRRHCLRTRSRLYIAVPAAVILLVVTQLVPGRFNPLYRGDVTLVERVEAFTAKRLLTETRLRILVVSMRMLVPEAPILGHGWASFQYVYPKAQGEYYRDNPDSSLAPTPFRTDKAHNEYLQLLVENGIVGCAILAAGFFFLMRGGWMVFRRTIMPHHIGIQVGILCSIVALLMHCAVDFPLRIPPIASAMVFLLAIWSAGDRLWVFPMNAPRDEEDQTAAIPARGGVPARWGMAAIAGGGLLGAAAMLLAVSFAPFQSAATRIQKSASYLLNFRALPNAEYLQDEARSEAIGARRIFWLSGPANRLVAQCEFLRAVAAYRKADAAAQAGDLTAASAHRGYAESLALMALTGLNMSLSEERFHGIYRLRSDIKGLLAQNSAGDERRIYSDESVQDLYAAVDMNPGDHVSLFALIVTLERQPVLQRTEIVRHMRLLNHFHDDYFRATVFQRVLDALYVGAVSEADDRLEMIVEAVPEDPTYLYALGSTSLAAGRLDRAREIARVMQEHSRGPGHEALREHAAMILAQAAIKSGDSAAALSVLSEPTAFPTTPAALRIAMLLHLAEDPLAKEQHRRDLDRLGAQDPVNLQIAGIVAFEQFKDYAEAAKWLEERNSLVYPVPPMDIQGNLVLARCHAELGNWSRVLELLDRVEKMETTGYARGLVAGIDAELRARAAAASPAP